MVKQILAPLLVLALSTAGMPPCVGMGMEMGPASGDMGRHHCCDGDTCAETTSGSMRAGGQVPLADCCLVRPVDAVQLPARAVSAVTWQVTLFPAVVPPGVRSPEDPWSHLPLARPPGSPSVSRHLLLTVLLI